MAIDAGQVCFQRIGSGSIRCLFDQFCRLFDLNKIEKSILSKEKRKRKKKNETKRYYELADFNLIIKLPFYNTHAYNQNLAPLSLSTCLIPRSTLLIHRRAKTCV